MQEIASVPFWLQSRSRLVRWRGMSRYFPVICFWLTLAIAVALAGLVWRAPLYEEPAPWLRLYANDATLRRVTIAAAVGLLSTAAVFFRWRPLTFGQVRRPDGSRPETADAAGA